MDGDEVTSWQEGVEGPGIGETIYYKLDQEQPITYLTFKLGNWRNDKYFYGNNRPRTLTITLDDYSLPDYLPGGTAGVCGAGGPALSGQLYRVSDRRCLQGFLLRRYLYRGSWGCTVR